jgi:hypothetical protein
VAPGARQRRSLDHAAAVSCTWPRAASALTTTFSPQPGYPVGAATSAGEDVVDTLDGDVGAQHGPEYREFRTAQTLASRRRRANRAVVLDKQEASSGLFGHACHIALAAPDLRESGDLLTKRTLLAEAFAIVGNARRLAMRDQPFQSLIAENIPRRAQEVERQIGMTVGEAVVTTLRQPPIFPWSSAPFALVLALHQALRLELDEVLTRARRRHVKARADIGGRLRSARLQLKQDAILTAAVVLTHEAILETSYYLK